MRRGIWVLIFFLLFSLVSANAALAQEPTPTTNMPTDDQVNAIAKQMYCPVCENTPLDVCPTQACAEWRELIRDKLALGWSEEQIKQYFVEQFGDRVLAEPPARGINWLVYVIPPLAFLAGAFILFRALRTWRQAAPQANTSETPAGFTAPVPPVVSEADNKTAEYINQLEEELRKL